MSIISKLINRAGKVINFIKLLFSEPFISDSINRKLYSTELTDNKEFKFYLDDFERKVREGREKISNRID